LGIGDWGWGIGDWGLAQSPIPNPQSPIPNPQSPFLIKFFIINKIIFIILIFKTISNKFLNNINYNILIIYLTYILN